jgi:hypothetical protein
VFCSSFDLSISFFLSLPQHHHSIKQANYIKMGQSNTKPQQQEHPPQTQPKQQQRPTERRRTSSRRHDTPELSIKPQGTFDSHFTLISPMSELSAPSMFLSKRHEQNMASNLPPGTNPQNANNIIIPNVPPLPAELQFMANNSSRNVERQQLTRDDVPLLKKKKGKKSKSSKQQKAQRVMEAFAGCVIVTAEHADKMRVVTTKAATTCAKKTGECAKKTGQMIEDSGVVEKSGIAALNCAKKTKAVAVAGVKKTGQMIEDSGVVEKSGIAALNCAKATKAVAAAGAKELAGAVTKGCKQSQISNENERMYDCMSEAARNSLDIANDSNHAIVLSVEDPHQEAPVPFEPVWRESRGMIATTYAPSNPADAAPGSSWKEVTTPLAQLDRAFKAAVGLHSEDDYFDRLSAGPTAPSPFVQALPDISAIPQVEQSRESSVNASLFSETSLTRLDTADPDFAREVVSQPATQKISNFDVVSSKQAPTNKPVVTGVLKEMKKRHNASKPVIKKSYQRAEEEISVAGLPSIDRIEQKFESKPAAKTTRVANTRSIFRQMDARKKDIGIKQAKSFGSLRVTESAPSVMEAKDYRNIALSTSEGGVSNATAPGRIQPQYYTLCSPSASSTCSNGENSKGPLLTTQTLSNAAFLFSPSYAGGDEQLLQREQVTRDPAFSISTFASRARISNFSSRSQAITIPVSKSWEATSAAEGRGCDVSDGHSLDKSSKHVRFSEANQYREIQSSKPLKVISNKSSLSVQTKKVPEKVEAPEIETKLSDLTEATILDMRVSFDGVSPATTASSLSNRRISFSQPLLDELSPESPGSSPSNSAYEDQSRASSSNEQGSVHWTYREENGKITTTPKFGKKRTTSSKTLPSTSPMIRFRAAQNKFANPSEKVVPVKKTPPKKFANRTPKQDLVSTRITVLNDRLKSTRQPVAKNTRRDTGGHRVLAPHRANLVNPIFRNSASSTDDNDRRIMRSVTDEETPFDETGQNISPAAASRLNCSDTSEDMFAKLVLGKNEAARNDASFSIADTDASEDPFADVIKSNYEAEPEIPGASIQQRGARFSGNSVYSFATHTSNIKRYSSGSTVVTNKENTVSSTSLHKQAGRGQVNPADAYNHHESAANLCLSPRQRTPMQARKWRTMAAAAQEKESSKKSTSKRSNRKTLSERSVNVH